MSREYYFAFSFPPPLALSLFSIDRVFVKTSYGASTSAVRLSCNSVIRNGRLTRWFGGGGNDERFRLSRLTSDNSIELIRRGGRGINGCIIGLFLQVLGENKRERGGRCILRSGRRFFFFSIASIARGAGPREERVSGRSTRIIA